MKTSTTRSLILCCLSASLFFLATPVLADSKTNYWDGDRVKQRASSSRSYTAAMHNRFPGIREKYLEGGEFFYSDHINSFGQKEALNTETEVVFCGPGDRNFTQTIEWLQDSAAQSGFNTSEPFSVRDDSSTVGFSAEQFDTAVRETLTNNATATAKGRFCYDLNDVAQNVDYRTPGAEREVYCDPSDTGKLSFTDSISGFNCEIALDSPLKVGETKFMRQLQKNGLRTIAQGFAGCYRNEVSGLAEFKLIENPGTCNQKDRTSCNYTCEWAHKMVCDGKDMPRWGGGRCGGSPTMLFSGDSIVVSSTDQLSYDPASKTLFQGEAMMQCSLVGGQAQWVITKNSCDVKASR